MLVSRRALPLLLAVLLPLLLALAAPAAPAATKHKAPADRGLDAAFSVDVSAPPGQAVPTTNGMTLWVPKGVFAGGDRLVSCDPAAIAARGLSICPQRSIVGKGKASGLIQFISQSAIEPMTVTMVNGPRNTLLAHVRGISPVSIDVVIQSIITRPGGRYGMQMDFPFPDSLIHPVPGSTASVLHLDAHLSGKTGWLRSTSCPPTGWSLGALMHYTDGATLKIAADLACV
jgi:hypothetical protein